MKMEGGQRDVARRSGGEHDGGVLPAQGIDRNILPRAHAKSESNTEPAKEGQIGLQSPGGKPVGVEGKQGAAGLRKSVEDRASAAATAQSESRSQAGRACAHDSDRRAVARESEWGRVVDL
jgi:hypothetical protein